MTEPVDTHGADAIAAVLAEYAAGAYEARVPVAGPLSEVARAVNALGEQLGQDRPIREAQFDALLDQLVSIASLQFDRRVATEGDSGGFHALAVGLNMLTEELEAVVSARDRVQALYRLAFEHAPVGMVLADPNGTFVQVNPAFGRMLGVPHDSLVGSSWRAITHPEDVLEGTLQAQALYSGDIEKIEMEKRYVASDGRIIWGSVNVALVRDDDGHPLYTLAQVLDINEQKESADALRRARDRALESDRLKTEFLRNVSHEIRTPMTSVLGMTELALATELTPVQQEHLEIAMASGRSLLDLVDGILQLSKIESGVLEPEMAPVHIRAIVKAALDPLQARAERAGLAFGVHVDDAVPDLVTTDAVWINQILTNLAGNAVKFTAQGRVDVRVAVAHAPAGHELILEVADTGIGVPEESRRLIFEPFRQADGSTTRAFGGTGLGLAITERLVRRLGGTIDVADSRGRGAAFTVVLPLSPGPRRLEVPAEHALAPQRLDGVRALVAEDRADHLLVITRALESSGCEVTAVGDGRAAIAAVAAEPFDVALIDLQMPELDGLDAIAAIRMAESGHPQRVPILAVTAHALDVDRDRALAAGADGYLIKPFTGRRLIEAVSETMVVTGPSRR